MTKLEMDCNYFKIHSCFQKFSCFRFLLRKSLINVLLQFQVWKERTEDTKNDLPKNVEHSVALLQIQINAANRFTDFYHNVILQIEPLLGDHVWFSEIFALHTYYPVRWAKLRYGRNVRLRLHTISTTNMGRGRVETLRSPPWTPLNWPTVKFWASAAMHHATSEQTQHEEIKGLSFFPGYGLIMYTVRIVSN